ncbi:MAG: DnaJ C-terminal domain-containing protein [Arenimonas sp.]
MEFKDYYEILGVEASAGEAELKTAYRRLARKYHPDVSKEKGAEEKFKSINEAYEVLRDKDKRQQYDQLRARGYRSGQEYQPPPGFGGGGGFQQGFGNAGGGGDFSDFFESLFGGRGRASQQPLGDTRAKVAIPLDIAFSGGQQRFNVDGRTLEVKIPAGIKPGQVIRLAGQGRTSGLRKSDLLLEIDYRPHADFEVDDRNILYTLSLAPWEAALGTTAAVPTLGGAVELKIPADSEAGKKLRLRGRGLPGKPNAGDQIVEIEIRAPKAETEAQKDFYKKMAEVFFGQ